MEQIISGDTRTTEEHIKHHLTLKEQLAQLEAKDKKAKETEARRKAKIAKLRSALLSQKRETFDKVLSAHGIQTESQLQEAMALYAKIRGAGITTPEQLDVYAKCPTAQTNIGYPWDIFTCQELYNGHGTR